jgi:hypothetical protein
MAQGKGIIEDIGKKFKKVKRATQTTANRLISNVSDKVEQAKKTVDAVVYSPTELSASVRDILAKYGDKPITKAIVVRTPVSAVVKEALNVVSLGEFKKKLAAQPYDDIFHLFMLFTLSDGTTVSLEKNSIITMRVNPDRKGDSREASPPEGLTLNELMEATRKKMGKKFIPYAANSNNCQNFILNVLRANKMDTPELDTFVKQDTNELFDGDGGFLRNFSQQITNLGAKIATVQEGVGVKKTNKWIEFVKKHAVENGMSYREALRSASTKEAYRQ